MASDEDQARRVFTPMLGSDDRPVPKNVKKSAAGRARAALHAADRKTGLFCFVSFLHL